MGVAKRTRKFAQVKRVIGRGDGRLKENKEKALAVQKKKEAAAAADEIIREVPQEPSNLFFQHNTALVPPYSILVDTNFITHSVQRKLSLEESSMDCLYAKCNILVTTCVLAELEKLGTRYRLALRAAKDVISRGNGQLVRCTHKGTYADDCLVSQVVKHRIYIVGTNDKELLPGVPIMKVARGKYVIERLPGAPDT